MYTLTKLELEEGKNSLVPVGHSTTSTNLTLFDWETEKKRAIKGLTEVQEGWQVILHSLRDYHRTSKIQEIKEQSSDKVVFRTETSIYQLTKNN